MQDAGLINDARALHYLFLIPITFLYWDHLMTFGDEVRFLWRKPKTPSTYCFFLNRYLACFSDVAVAIFVFSTVPPSVCTTFNLIRQIVLLLNEITICALLTLRIYALYDRDRRVWIYMLGAGIVLIAVSCWAISGERGIPQPDVVGCHIANSFKNGVHLAVPWESLFIYDVMIFVTLFYKSLRRRSEFGMTWTNIPILTLLLRDGAMYFVIMAVVNLANILTFYLADPLLRAAYRLSPAACP
ncbi:hypothetical protein B0H10DRAFT_355111 [Mycena sp. CBHHK59/15]|nr:hypothetical protein B0H10DRAFT_355111 [Mycena sp. CBHHK59/15]